MELPIDIGHGNRRQIVSFTPEGDGLHLIRVFDSNDRDNQVGGGKDFVELQLLIDPLLNMVADKETVLDKCQKVEQGSPEDYELVISTSPLVKFFTESCGNISHLRRMWGSEKNHRSVLGGTFRFLEMSYYIRIIELHTTYMLDMKAKRLAREIEDGQ